MKQAIHEAIKNKVPFTAVSLVDGKYQAWGVFNPSYIKEQT